MNARFDYSYNNFRVTSMQAVINENPLPIDLYRYVDVSGRVEQFGKFSVIFYDRNQVRRGKAPLGSTKGRKGGSSIEEGVTHGALLAGFWP